MTKVIISSDSRYKVNRKKIREAVVGFLKRQKISGNIEIGVSIVGSRKMRDLNLKFRGWEKPCAVLAFPLESGVRGGFVNPPEKILRLGDVVISFPEVVKLAAEENVLVEEKIEELVSHGLKHLLGGGV